MRAGSLRQQVTIQSRPPQRDGYNQASGNWTDIEGLIKRQCNINDLSGLELIRAQKIVAECTVMIIMRGFHGWRTVITPACRGVSGTAATGVRLFDIKAVINPDGRDRELHLLCVEIV